MLKVFVGVLLFFGGIISAQNDWPKQWPLDIPPALTANYGQLRANHFHAGIDLSTNGGVNLAVHAVDDAYVSRIKVSAYGYGKALYLTHANGKVTVYAHLNAYSPKIDSIIKKEQYKIESYEIDFYPTFRFRIKKGEVIGLSGNTGGSTGPHLHFEIRDELSEVPLNPLNYYHLKDHIKPTLQALAFFDLSDTLNPKFLKSIKIAQTKTGSAPVQNSVTISSGLFGVAFAGFDKNDGNPHLNNIYATKLFFDKNEIYTHLLQAVSFDESRYVNEYAEAANGLVFQKCFLPVLAPADFVMNSSNHTRIFLRDTNYHKITLQVADEANNINEVSIYVRSKKTGSYYSNLSTYDLIVDCKKTLQFKKGNLTLSCPPYTFFISSPLTVKNNLESAGSLVMLPADLNLKSAMTVAFKVPEAILANKEKMLLKNNGNIYTPVFHGDSALFQIKNLGWFQLTYDKQAPTIQSLQKNKKFATQRLSFTIKDDLSGIAAYKLYVNDRFCLAEFDAKNNLLTYNFEKNDPHGLINVTLDVFDKSGNKSSGHWQLNR